jgi:farnesyl diphosphate synthase
VPGREFQARFTWSDVDRLKARFAIPLILKGIATAEDAELALEHGVDIIYVSNHGGRQLDHGKGGMAGGQMLDLAAEGRFDTKRTLSENEIATLQAMKTGALIRFACRAGAILGNADAAACARIDRYGVVVGQAFQVADDLLDVEGDAKTLGKAAGKDAAAGKATLVAALGIDGARARLKQLLTEADAALAPFGAKADTLRAAARFIAERTT